MGRLNIELEEILELRTDKDKKDELLIKYKKLKDNQCPFCNGLMSPINPNPRDDSFEFKCKTCNDNTIISLSDSAVKELENITKDFMLLKYYIEKIKNSKTEVTQINLND